MSFCMIEDMKNQTSQFYRRKSFPAFPIMCFTLSITINYLTRKFIAKLKRKGRTIHSGSIIETM